MPAKKTLELRIDGRKVGTITVAANATERQKVLAAFKIPGVRERLEKSGVAAAQWSAGYYDILTKLTPELEKLRSNPSARGGVKQNPYRGLGVV